MVATQDYSQALVVSVCHGSEVKDAIFEILRHQDGFGSFCNGKGYRRSRSIR